MFMFVAAAVLFASNGRPQGYFEFSTVGIVRTHIGSIDGPLAGANIWAQMLAGPSPDALSPVAVPAKHLVLASGPTGWISAGVYAVPGIPDGQTAFFEMLVWDGARWGTSLSGVPKDQFGMTDIVPLVLADDFGPPAYPPPFRRSAIVPVPEPTTSAIVVLAAAGTLLCWAVRRRVELGSRRMTRRRAE